MTTPGWYENPENNNEWRWWDGMEWTNNTSPKAPPVPSSPIPAPQFNPAAGSGHNLMQYGVPGYGQHMNKYESNRIRRYFARTIDGLLLIIPIMGIIILGAILLIPNTTVTDTGQIDEFGRPIQDIDLPSWGIPLIIGFAFFILFVTLFYEFIMIQRQSATYGKKWLGLIIVDDVTGEPVAGRTDVALKRTAGVFLTQIPYIGGLASLINIFMVLIDPHRSLFDRLAGTKVVKR